ncbi:hypothetical protein ABZS29_06875 [Kribbella sp. NPDC005582]|uniref:hypothetical protein n=1 Tax=Kribbella sp. NPDC005582 TaxID=3156893 RepID=UPI0033A5E55F
MARRGGPPQQLTGVAPAGCLLSRDAASSSLTVDAFAIDVRGNVWLGGGAPTSVITPDGVLRKLPGGADGISSIEARPDGSVLLGTSPGGGSQILQIPDAASAASTYPPAPEPEPRCDRRKTLRGTTTFRATVLPPVETVDPHQGAPGVSTQLGLDAAGKLVRIRLPLAAHSWAPDGQGGVWWTLADPDRAVHLVRGRTTVHRKLDLYGPNGVRRVVVNGELQPLSDAPGTWFTGPDGKLWGYDALHLLRMDAGRVTVLAGPEQGVPQAAEQVTVIGQALYFQLGNDLVRLETTR